MEDTPEHIKKLQLENWLAKPPGERLKLTLQMNDDLYAFWNGAKIIGPKEKDKTQDK